MKKIALIGLVVISCAMARDCRYEEQELNSLIRQYEDLKDDYRIEELSIFQEYYTGQKDIKDATNEKLLLHNRYNVRFNRLNQRIEQAKQQLNNCRRKK